MTQGPATDNPVGYISHHLQPLQAGSGFWQFNIDTIFFEGKNISTTDLYVNINDVFKIFSHGYSYAKDFFDN